MAPFGGKNCEMDTREVVCQGRAESPLIKVPEKVKLALKRLLRGQALAKLSWAGGRASVSWA